MRPCLSLVLILSVALSAASAAEPPSDPALAEIRAAVASEHWIEVRRQAMLALSRDLDDQQRQQLEIWLRQADGALATDKGETETRSVIERRRQELRHLLQSHVSEQELWQAFVELQRLAPDDPLVRETEANFRPPWAASSGRDQYGRWAMLRIGRVLLRLRVIPAGSQLLPDGRRLAVSREFWIGETEVTSALIGSITDAASYTGADRQPARGLMPEEIVQQVQELQSKAPEQCRLRLPTPEEWEYAARAGVELPRLPQVIGYRSAAIDGLGPAPVGSFAANNWGLFDIHGNVWELSQDQHGQLWRHGGGWRSRLADCRLDLRRPVSSWQADQTLGYRLLLEDLR